MFFIKIILDNLFQNDIEKSIKIFNFLVIGDLTARIVDPIRIVGNKRLHIKIYKVKY